MKRYNLDEIPGSDWYAACPTMTEHPQGEYCLYEDVPGWVSVAKKMPPYDIPVFVISENYPDQLGAAVLRWESEGWYWEEYNGIGMDFRDPANYECDDDYNFTHWQPLPEPPGDDDD